MHIHIHKRLGVRPSLLPQQCFGTTPSLSRPSILKHPQIAEYQALWGTSWNMDKWGKKFCCSVAKSFSTLCNPIDYSTPSFPVLHYLLESTQIHVCWVSNTIQPPHPLLSPSPTFNLSKYQGIFQGVGSLHQMAKVLEFQLQRQSFLRIFRTDFL